MGLADLPTLGHWARLTGQWGGKSSRPISRVWVLRGKARRTSTRDRFPSVFGLRGLRSPKIPLMTLVVSRPL